MTRQTETIWIPRARTFEVHLDSSAGEAELRESFSRYGANVAPLFIYPREQGGIVLVDSKPLREIKEVDKLLEMDVRVVYRVLGKANFDFPEGDMPFTSRHYYRKDDTSVPDAIEEFTLCSQRLPLFSKPRLFEGKLYGGWPKQIYNIWRKQNEEK